MARKSMPPRLKHPTGPTLFWVFAVYWLVFALLHDFFVSFPLYDIRWSARFYDARDGFWVNQIGILQAVRGLLWLSVAGLLILSWVALVLRLWGRELWSVPARAWGFVSLLILIGPLFVANTLLKGLSGRARPAHIEAFGGDRVFTPAFDFTDQCVKNCSFVSGEGSGVTAFAIGVWTLSAFRGPDRWRAAMRIGALGILATGLMLRVMKGRHFPSDTIFAVMFMGLVAFILYLVLLWRKV